jgi:penicillin-binding protein 2
MFLKNRINQVIIFIIILHLILIFSLTDVTIINGEYYKDQSINNRLKKIEINSKRGEIFDRNGVLLAGNKLAFTIQFLGDGLDDSVFNQVSIDLIKYLDEKGEQHITFPIIKTINGFEYSYDNSIKEWLLQNGFDEKTSAREVFDTYKSNNEIPSTFDDYEAQRYFIMKGVNLPISVKSMKFLNQIEKENFLELYNLDTTISATEAFQELKVYPKFKIDQYKTDDEVLAILTLRHAFKLKGYLKYEPIKISSNVSKETAIILQEKAMNFPGVNIIIEPLRYYPNDNTASHILGYMGKISSDTEIEKFVTGLGYQKSDIIGKSGIEASFEEYLKGTDGQRYIEVDAYGHVVREIDDPIGPFVNEDAKAGQDVTLTIDINLQKKVEEFLKKGIDAIRSGSVYETKWGNYQYKEYDQALTGTAIVLDVNKGEVLAMASYPDYDLNMFSTGISAQNWELLNTGNPNNPLAPRPLYNLATMTAVQPGSIFKMITAVAALEKGLDPDLKLYSDGYLELGGQTFGCWIWNNEAIRGKHGLTDLYKAIGVSCNYYFYDIASAYDYYRDKSLGYSFEAQDLLDYAIKFGLNEKTGIEVNESIKGVPDTLKKLTSIEYGLRNFLKNNLSEYFPNFIYLDEKKANIVIEEIVAMASQDPTRNQIIKKLEELNINEGSQYKLADIIKYDYFKRMVWYDGDTLNLSIGQGDHQYTPLQIARYIMAIANGGYLHEITVVKDVEGKIVRDNLAKETIIENVEYLEDVKKGMYYVTNVQGGTAYSIFKNFPIQIGAKSGTAEKEGKIPPDDEVAYLIENMRKLDSSLNVEKVKVETQTIISERNKELLDIQTQVNTLKDEEQKAELQDIIAQKINSGYLEDQSAMREAIKRLSKIEITDTMINQFRKDYDNYAWFVSFAPYDNPEIVVLVLIPQGGSGNYGAPIARDIIAEYFKLK